MACSRKTGFRKRAILISSTTVILVSAAQLTFWASLSSGYQLPSPIRPGPKVIATKGAVWPTPSYITSELKYFTINPRKFKFQTTGLNCTTIEKAYTRYQNIMRKESSVGDFRNEVNLDGDSFYAGFIDRLDVQLTGKCEKRPTADMKESYTLTINGTGAGHTLIATSSWGLLRGLETFVQLLYPAGDGLTLLVNETSIEDSPRFPHRGLLIDTSRHYLPVPYILLELDAMAAVKMNVLHWHIVDDQSFPYQSRRYPELSNKGAYNNVSAIYTPKDINVVIEYARRRGIRVIPEFDTPGHTRSWNEGQPGLITECYAGGRPTGEFSNLDPTKDENLHFIKDFFAEVGTVFHDNQVHIGGDEVPDECWSTNPGVLSYMKSKNISGNYGKLQSMYIEWLTETLETQGKECIAWEEVFTTKGSDLPRSLIIHIWLTSSSVLLPMVVKSGYRALLSQGWYLDHLNNQWEAMYMVEPYTRNMTAAEKKRVLGGEACMWGEMVDKTNLHSRVWPRAAAVAERLWSPQYVRSLDLAERRLEELTCRLNRRGIPASPASGPGFCET